MIALRVRRSAPTRSTTSPVTSSTSYSTRRGPFLSLHSNDVSRTGFDESSSFACSTPPSLIPPYRRCLVGSGIAKRFVAVGVLPSSPRSELKKTVEMQYDDRNNTSKYNIFYRKDPFLFNLFRAVKLVEEFGRRLEDYIYFREKGPSDDNKYAYEVDLPNDFTYGDHYQISVYENCKPCPPRLINAW